MALTDAQKASCRLYLGASDFSASGVSTALERALTALSSSAETQVAALLVKLATIETDLSASWDRQKVIKAEEVTLAAEGELRALRSEGRRLARQLGIIFGIEPISDAFGTGFAATGPCGRG